MLSLNRRVGESIIIGDDIVVTILRVKGSQIYVGINAPKEVSIHREEIYHRIQCEKIAAIESKLKFEKTAVKMI